LAGFKIYQEYFTKKSMISYFFLVIYIYIYI